MTGRGWRDIGYDFLIDKFGRIWEGRYGGMTRAVVGAYTLDYNSYAFGAAVLGTYNAKSVAGQTIGNFAVCGIGFDAIFDDFVSIFASQTTHVILDITGLSVLHPAQVLQPQPSGALSSTAATDVRRSRAAGAAERLREINAR